MSVWDNITHWLNNKFGNSGPGVTSSAPPIYKGPQIVIPSATNSGTGLDPGAGISLPVITPGGQYGNPTDPMQNYLNQLLKGINSGQPHMLSLAQLRDQATKQVAPEFDSQISALLGEQSATKKRAGANKKEITSMYKQLADSYTGDVATSKKQTKDAKNAEKAAYNQLQKSLSGQYSQQLDAQSKELGDLGISAALGEATKGQKEDLGFLKSLNATESAAQQRAIDLSGLADQSYYSEGRGGAIMEGNENVSDLMKSLEDYLRQSGSQISGLRGQKASAISQLVNSMYNNQQNQATQFDSTKWNRLLQIAQLQHTLQNDALAQMAAQSKGTQMPTKGLEGAYGVLQQSLGGNAQNGINALMNLLQTQPFTENRFQAKNKDIVNMTPNNAAVLARQYAQQHKLTPAETDALVKAIYAYYGKLQ